MAVLESEREMSIEQIIRRQASASVVARNPHLFKTAQPEEKARLSTDEQKLNKWEREWLAVLREIYPWVGIQNVTLKLAHDTRYTPDFITTSREGRLVAWEVKGFFRDDAKVKIKVAARMFQFIKFILICKSSKSGWEQTEVKP